MTPSEFYTTQFYTWEYRGRGWFVADEPIHLEAPFIPYYRHGYPKTPIDDGKRHTIVSKLLESLHGEKEPVFQEQQVLDYETIEPFCYTEVVDLKALQVKLPKERKVTPEKMKALLVMISYIDAPISFEIIGTATEIIIQFVCTLAYSDTIETYINAFFPSCSIIESDSYVKQILREGLSAAVVDFGLKHEFVRSIYTAKTFSLDPLIGVMSVLERLTENEQAGMQILFQPVVNHWNESILRSVTMDDGSSFFLDAPDAPQMALDKVQSPLYAVTIRTFGQAIEIKEAFTILEKITAAVVQRSKGTHNELIPLSDPVYDFEQRAGDILTRESHRLGMLLNIDELISLLHFPSESISSKKLYASARKTKEVPVIAKQKAFVLGENIHNGIQHTVTAGIAERLKHTHIVGATGTGKSTLIANLILQDIEKGIGVVLFDPHGDLVDDIVSRIPRTRIHDVVLVDPSDTDYPIGLNILEAHSDIEKEVLSSDLVAIFRKYATSWGDQMNAVLANAILAILESKEGGSLHDLRRFLIENDYRNTFLKTVTDPAVLYYWHKEYPLLKSNSIGPILTRLNTFLRPKAIRNMVVQKKGLDFKTLLNTNKIILFKLSQGLIGIENSFLLGSLILSKLHQAILQRQQQADRNPVFLYLDEFHNFITPSIKEIISGIRKYNVGLILSHQDLQQLQREDGELLNSVLGNCTTRVVFRVGEVDSKRLQDGFSGFDYIDLQNLGRGEAIIRIEQPQYDCSLDTIPLQEISALQSNENKEAVIAFCRKHYATPKDIIEGALFKSYNIEPIDDSKKEDVPPVEKPLPKETNATVFQKVEKIVIPESAQPSEIKDVSVHRYLQTLVKKMAEARGYIATIEMPLPSGNGQVDVLLAKDGKTIAVEICNTTDPDWEMHNIIKCIDARYTQIVSLSGDKKQLEKIKQKCLTGIADFEKHSIFFFTPDALFTFLDQLVKGQVPDEVNMKGYRVTVSYDDTITNEEMNRKRASVSQVILNTMRKRKKKQ
jgi:Type IV secretion-system coupling protein DNA-binding domain